MPSRDKGGSFPRQASYSYTVIPEGRTILAQTTDRIRTVERVTLTKITIAEGDGVSGSPVRAVTYWYDDDGKRIARQDNWDKRIELEHPE